MAGISAHPSLDKQPNIHRIENGKGYATNFNDDDAKSNAGKVGDADNSSNKKQSDSDDGLMDFNFGMSEYDESTKTVIVDHSTHGIANYTHNEDENKIDVRRCDPLTVLIDPYRQCMKIIQNDLIDLASDILYRERFSRFPKLCSRIKDIVSNSIVPHRYQEVIGDIEKRILAEKRCVWTDNIEFNTRILPSVINASTMKNKDNKNNKDIKDMNDVNKRQINLSGEIPINPDAIRVVLYEYFKIIKSDLMTYIHKQIIGFFVMEVVSDVNTGLNDKILEKSTLDVLLEENKDKATKRAELYSLKQKINSIKTMIKDME